jgi:hypothetical protein
VPPISPEAERLYTDIARAASRAQGDRRAALEQTATLRRSSLGPDQGAVQAGRALRADLDETITSLGAVRDRALTLFGARSTNAKDLSEDIEATRSVRDGLDAALRAAPRSGGQLGSLTITLGSGTSITIPDGGGDTSIVVTDRTGSPSSQRPSPPQRPRRGSSESPRSPRGSGEYPRSPRGSGDYPRSLRQSGDFTRYQPSSPSHLAQSFTPEAPFVTSAQSPRLYTPTPLSLAPSLSPAWTSSLTLRPPASPHAPTPPAASHARAPYDPPFTTTTTVTRTVTYDAPPPSTPPATHRQIIAQAMRERTHTTPSPRPNLKIRLDSVQEGAQACVWDPDSLDEYELSAIIENYIDPGIADAERALTRTRNPNTARTLEEMITMYEGARDVATEGGASVVFAFNANQEVAGLGLWSETSGGRPMRVKDICSNPATIAGAREMGGTLLLTALNTLSRREFQAGRSDGTMIVEPLQREGGRAVGFYERHGFRPGPWRGAWQVHCDDYDETGGRRR